MVYHACMIKMLPRCTHVEDISTVYIHDRNPLAPPCEEHQAADVVNMFAVSCYVSSFIVCCRSADLRSAMADLRSASA